MKLGMTTGHGVVGGIKIYENNLLRNKNDWGSGETGSVYGAVHRLPGVKPTT